MSRVLKGTLKEQVWKVVQASSGPVSSNEISDELQKRVDKVRKALTELWKAGFVDREKVQPGAHWWYAYRPAISFIRKGKLDGRLNNGRNLPRDGATESRRVLTLVNQCAHAGGWRNIAGAIVMLAVLDWRCQTAEEEDFATRMQFVSPAEELHEFWQSDFGQYMRDELGIGRLGLEDVGNTLAGQRRPETMA